MSYLLGRFTGGKFDCEFASKVDFTHEYFVYFHVEIKVCTRKSPNTSEFARNSSHVNLPACAQSLADNFTNDITLGKNKNLTFFWLGDSEKLKNFSIGRWTQMKDISDAGLMTYA